MRSWDASIRKCFVRTVISSGRLSHGRKLLMLGTGEIDRSSENPGGDEDADPRHQA